MKLLLFLLPFIGSVLAVSIPREEAAATPCTCEPMSCIQSWPDSCYCANAAKQACYEKCGGTAPVYDTCPPQPSTCECEETVCLDSWPESCYCQNKAKEACFNKCGGKKPTYQTCPPLPSPLSSPPPPAPVVARTEPKPATECKCTEINCTLMWPAGCYCKNYAKQLCYEECGGERPTLDTCHNPSTPKPTNQICGGAFPPCPSGQACIPDPFKPGSCGPACGETGICVEDKKMCGGFMGLECEQKGQACVDDPRDECDSKRGGADCAGVCVWPQ